MTCGAGNRFMRTNQWEGGCTVIKDRIGPGGGLMASSAARAELTVMGILGGMTGETVFRCAFIHSVHMA